MRKQFEDICYFNHLMGKEESSAVDDYIKRDNQMTLIDEEYRELLDATVSQDKTEIRKEACDVIVVCIGFAYLMGIDTESFLPVDVKFNLEDLDVVDMRKILKGERHPNENMIKALNFYITTAAQVNDTAGGNIEKDLQAVNVSNLSKFCETLEEIQKTSKMYDDLRIEYHVRIVDSSYSAFISSENQTSIENKFYAKGKLLKPCHYLPPELI